MKKGRPRFVLVHTTRPLQVACHPKFGRTQAVASLEQRVDCVIGPQQVLEWYLHVLVLCECESFIH